MKTRIVKLDSERWIPQRWVPHFMFGGHWEGIQCTKKGSWYTYEGFDGMKKYCVLPTERLAIELLIKFQQYIFEKELATK